MSRNHRTSKLIFLRIVLALTVVASALTLIPEHANGLSCRKMAGFDKCKIGGKWIDRDKLPPKIRPTNPPPGGDGDTDRPAGDDSGAGSGGKTAIEIWQDKIDEIKESNDKAIDRYKDQFGDFITCNGASSDTACGEAPTPPDLQDLPPRPNDPGDEEDPGPSAPVITPPQAAWIVISSELVIPKLGIGIGPSPEQSRWNMAVVGYPYWFWAEGETEARASATAGGHAVGLHATLSEFTLDMGDGSKIHCKGAGTRWVNDSSNSKEPVESPTCGYRWKKMSGKETDYTLTMTATWRVDWVVDDVTGTEYLATTARRQVPVGELQTVVDG